MVSITSTARLGLVLLALSGCGKFHSQSVITQAPNSQAEAQGRLIIQGTAAEAQAIIEASEGVRVLSAKHNLYEVQGLSQNEVAEIAPGAQASPNRYFKSMIESREISKDVALYQQVASGKNVGNIIPQSLPPALVGCNIEAPIKPIAKIALRSNVLTQSITMNLGETVAFTGAGSLSQLNEDELEIRWDFVAPGGSSLPRKVKIDPNADFTPDTVGMYQAILVAKSSDNSCGVKVARFMVTHNPAIEYVRDNEGKKTLPTDFFKHIDRINLKPAWSKVTGQGITIAVMDTGLNYNHLGIKHNLAVNWREKNGVVGQDDDSNEFEDDFLGWDFVNGDNLPFDDEGHGSHVGGLTSSHIHGSAPGSKILPIKVMNAGGGGDTGSLIAGIYYAADNGADVINASMQRLTQHIPALKTAVEYANAKGIVFISAAGNDGLDLSAPENQIYPGELDAPNVVNVAATGFNDLLTSYSNYGQVEVDVAAPGGDQQEPILSLATHNTRDDIFVPSGGTSMAAPVVAGVVALILEANPNLTPPQVKQVLMESGTSLQGLQVTVGSGKLLDADLAVSNALKSNTEQILF